MAPTVKVAGLPAQTVWSRGAVPKVTFADKADGRNNVRMATRPYPVICVKMFFIKDEMVLQDKRVIVAKISSFIPVSHRHGL